MALPWWVPRILRPDYTWPCPIASTIAVDTPPIPKVISKTQLRFWGLIHNILGRFSLMYATWTGADWEPACRPLPFGLVLKRTSRVRLEEVVAMQLARRAGMPVPKVISYGEHPRHFAQYSILMTRMPGMELSLWAVNEGDECYDPEDDFSYELGSSWMKDLNRCLDAMRKWQNPYGPSRISSILDTEITTTRVFRHRMGPFDCESDMVKYLQSTASTGNYTSIDAYKEDMALSGTLAENKHGLAFTHGDFMHHNILVNEDGTLSAILDWECAGWYPKYWDFTTVLRMDMGWWSKVVGHLGGDQYLDEVHRERALKKLTWDSYVGL